MLPKRLATIPKTSLTYREHLSATITRQLMLQLIVKYSISIICAALKAPSESNESSKRLTGLADHADTVQTTHAATLRQLKADIAAYEAQLPADICNTIQEDLSGYVTQLRNQMSQMGSKGAEQVQNYHDCLSQKANQILTPDHLAEQLAHDLDCSLDMVKQFMAQTPDSASHPYNREYSPSIPSQPAVNAPNFATGCSQAEQNLAGDIALAKQTTQQLLDNLSRTSTYLSELRLGATLVSGAAPTVNPLLRVGAEFLMDLAGGAIVHTVSYMRGDSPRKTNERLQIMSVINGATSSWVAYLIQSYMGFSETVSVKIPTTPGRTLKTPDLTQSHQNYQQVLNGSAQAARNLQAQGAEAADSYLGQLNTALSEARADIPGQIREEASLDQHFPLLPSNESCYSGPYTQHDALDTDMAFTAQNVETQHACLSRDVVLPGNSALNAPYSCEDSGPVDGLEKVCTTDLGESRLAPPPQNTLQSGASAIEVNPYVRFALDAPIYCPPIRRTDFIGTYTLSSGLLTGALPVLSFDRLIGNELVLSLSEGALPNLAPNGLTPMPLTLEIFGLTIPISDTATELTFSFLNNGTKLNVVDTPTGNTQLFDLPANPSLDFQLKMDPPAIVTKWSADGLNRGTAGSYDSVAVSWALSSPRLGIRADASLNATNELLTAALPADQAECVIEDLSLPTPAGIAPRALQILPKPPDAVTLVFEAANDTEILLGNAPNIQQAVMPTLVKAGAGIALATATLYGGPICATAAAAVSTCAIASTVSNVVTLENVHNRLTDLGNAASRITTRHRKIGPDGRDISVSRV